MARAETGRPAQVDIDLLDSETVLGRLEEPSRYPELDALRRTLLQWRFYHGLRTDAASPLRQPCPAVATPTLASDGSDLAAVFATLAHIRQDTADLRAVIDQAPGWKTTRSGPMVRAWTTWLTARRRAGRKSLTRVWRRLTPGFPCQARMFIGCFVKPRPGASRRRKHFGAEPPAPVDSL
jgi:hypothetical protein